MNILLSSYEGMLYSGDRLLIYRYPEGDVDTFSWPWDTRFRPEEEQRLQITNTLRDMRETGEIPKECTSATLPDGSTVDV